MISRIRRCSSRDESSQAKADTGLPDDYATCDSLSLTHRGPGRERTLVEIQAELADVERRLGRQLLNHEAEETTPALLKRIAVRVAELEDTVADRQQRARELAEQADSEAPTLPDVAPLLDRLPILAGGLTDTPQ